MNSDESSFYKQLKGYFERTLYYEDAALKEKARKCMNLSQLNSRARSKLDSLGLDGTYLRDMLLLEILEWFKYEFFTWMDKPSCHACQGITRLAGQTTPNNDRLGKKNITDRVEDYICTSCEAHTPFKRYSHPEKLLETRTGRCGEWANCFVLCCRAADFETRLVLGISMDHVWAEVYSDKQQRWLHCDPCENVCDKPLLYEAGWKRQLTYIVAFSYDNIQDVTWRYSGDHVELLKRRTSVNENWLVRAICKLRAERFRLLSPSQEAKNQILERTAVELVELLNPSNSSTENLSGRTSGSLAWRMARGELGSERDQPLAPYVIRPTETELASNCLSLSYSCSKDSYTRGDGLNAEVVSGWRSLLSEVKDVFRKVERDWKKAYLCRAENSSEATVKWKFDLSETDKMLRKVQIYVGCQCFENGRILLKMLNDSGKEVEIPPNEERTLEEFRGSKAISLVATMAGGRGENAWQHSQLFRQDLESSALPLRVKLIFED